MATSKIQVTEGSGKNLATNEITEDSVLKQIQRIVLNDSTGAEITQPLTDTQIRATPLAVSVSGVATAANQSTGNASLSSVDTKLSSQATATKQDLQTTALNSILAELQNDTAFSETVWYDANNTNNFYIRVATVNESTGVKTISFQNIDGTTANVTGLTLVQVISNTDFEFNSVLYKANIAGTGYSIGDRIQKLQIINMTSATLVNTIWNNETTGSILSTPPTFSNLVLDDSYATLAEQQSQTGKLTSIDGKLTNVATTSKQDTGNTSLASIDTNIGAKADAAATTDTGTFSLLAFFKRLLQGITTLNTSSTSIDTKTPSLGQALAAASTPVVLTAIQQAALTPPAAITGFALESTQTAQSTLYGSVAETAPASDTASSGLNGRLQRIAQNITSFIAKFPTTLGITTKANSLSVAIASDQAIPLSDGIKQTYSGGSVVAPVALATDVWILNGSATKTVRIRKIELIGSQTTGGYFTIILQKRSTANTGGTTANVQRVPNDSLSAASTVTYQSYTANPTALGTNIGSIRTEKIFFPAATLGTTKTVWEFGNSFDQALTLRGVAEGLALNLGGVTLTGGSLSFNVVWTEE